MFIRIGDGLLEGTDFKNNINMDEVKIGGKPAGGVRAILLLNPGDERIRALALALRRPCYWENTVCLHV